MFHSSTRFASDGRNRLSTYVLSLRDQGPSGLKYVLCCVLVAIMLGQTFGASPCPNAERHFVGDKTTTTTAFARRFPLTNLDECSSIPFRRVGQLPDQFEPGAICDRLSQFPVFHHVGCTQRFTNQRLVFTNQFGRYLVQPIPTDVGYSFLYLRNLQSCSVPPTRTFCPATQSPLLECQPLRVLACRSNVLKPLTVTCDSQCFDTEVDPNLCCCRRQTAVGFVDANTDEVFTGRGNTYRDCRRFGAKASGPSNIQSSDLCEGKVVVSAIPFEGRTGKLSRLMPLLPLKSRVLRPLLKEVDECRIQMAQALLQRNTRNLLEPSRFVLLLPTGQLLRSCPVSSSFTSLLVRVGSMLQCTIENITNTSERLRQNLLLCRSRIEPIFVRFDRHSNIIGSHTDTFGQPERKGNSSTA